jgi:ABC-type glycerol-3-phosphate transport system permease component
MTGTVDLGSMVAGFVFATIPLLVLFIFTSRLYIEGITSGAIKA